MLHFQKLIQYEEGLMKLLPGGANRSAQMPMTDEFELQNSRFALLGLTELCLNSVSSDDGTRSPGLCIADRVLGRTPVSLFNKRSSNSVPQVEY